MRYRRGIRLMTIIRKVVFVFWVIDSLGLAWLFGDMIAHGELIPESLALARYLGAIWGGLALIWGWMFWRGEKE